MKRYSTFYTRYRVLLLTCFTIISSTISFAQSSKQPVDYVDNFIGVRDANSSCVLGPQLPNASINPSPHTAPGKVNWDMDCYTMGHPIRGFGQLHVSGTGWGKYGQVFLSPQVGLAVGETEHDSPKENETATPYQYGVSLSRYGITTLVTPSVHSAIYKFTFPKTDSAHILLDVSHNVMDIASVMKRDNNGFINGEVNFTSKTGDELKGYGTYRGGFSDGDYKVFFCVRLSKAPIKKGTWLNGNISPGQTSQQSATINDRIGAYVQYNTKDKEDE